MILLLKKNPTIDIDTPDGIIDMTNTGIPLFANGTLLPPYSGKYNMGTTKVREIPATKGFIGYDTREGNIISGLAHDSDNLTFTANGVLPYGNPNPHQFFKGVLGFGIEGRVGDTSVGIGVDKPFVSNPFTGEDIHVPIQPKIKIKHRFEYGGEGGRTTALRNFMYDDERDKPFAQRGVETIDYDSYQTDNKKLRDNQFYNSPWLEGVKALHEKTQSKMDTIK